jgi:release factor glutamine methyltransferase
VTLAEALRAASAGGLDRLDAQLMLLQVLQRPAEDRAWLLAHDTDALSDRDAQVFCALCARRASGEPLAYIRGRKEFFGLDLLVDRSVLVPRADTEVLVEWALDVTAPDSRVLDLGTGSGAVALAIKKARPLADVHAVDASTGALEIARCNANRLGLEVRFSHSSWLQQVDGSFDVIVGNPPYVAESDPHLRALAHEPLAALVAGSDGLRELRNIISDAPARLRSGGWLILEHGWNQAEAVRELLRGAGLEDVASRHDLAGIERCSGGRRLELG